MRGLRLDENYVEIWMRLLVFFLKMVKIPKFQNFLLFYYFTILQTQKNAISDNILFTNSCAPVIVLFGNFYIHFSFGQKSF